MANQLSVLDMIAARAMKYAHEKPTFIKTIDRQFDESYNASTNGSKNGQTLRVRMPNQFVRRHGSRVMDVQDIKEQTQLITVATQDGVDLRVNSAELAQDIEQFDKRYIEPAMSSLVSGIDADAIEQATKDVYNTVGTAGTVIGSSSGDISAIYNGRARLNQCLAPKEGRSVQIDSVTMASITNGNKSIFQPSADVKEAFREGFYGRIAGADFYENERTWVLTNGSDVTGTTDSTGLGTADSDGGYSILDIDATIAANVQNAGMVFTISGVKACHPQTKQSLGYDQQFVIVSATTNATTVYPKIYLSGPRQNVCSSTGAQLATTDFDSKTLTFHGSASASYRQNLMYHKDFFAFVTAELPLMDDALKCVRMTKDGLSLRVWQASDIRNDEMLVRIDILYGFKTLRPEWAVRLSN
jgi:hypothetical protein